MALNELKYELCKIARLSYEKNLVSGAGGNLSIRENDRFFITPTGCCLGEVSPDTLVEVPLDEKRPISPLASMEAVMHRCIYNIRPQDRVIVHLHTYHSILAGLYFDTKRPMPAYTPGATISFADIPVVSFSPPGSTRLAQDVKIAAQCSALILLKNHGVVSVAKNPRRALNIVEELEINIRLHLKLMGNGALTSAQRQEILTGIYGGRT
jgi:ribulose-5-phosphate 4-epimerase/fuculose-1-phosphate aldolase